MQTPRLIRRGASGPVGPLLVRQISGVADPSGDGLPRRRRGVNGRLPGAALGRRGVAGGAETHVGCGVPASAAAAGWAEPARPPEGDWSPGGAFAGRVECLAAGHQAAVC
jgi:hypothetical protein